MSCLLVTVWLVVMYQAKFGVNNPATLVPDLIIVGTKTDNPPFMFWHDGHNSGFEPELVHEIAQRMGKKIVIKPLPESSLIDELTKEKIQVAIADFAQQKDSASIMFSRPYLSNSTHHLFGLTKNKIVLLQQLDAVLEEMKEDGSLTALQKKWHLF
jgi:ABC-type amino acid transport substrate-binding protein